MKPAARRHSGQACSTLNLKCNQATSLKSMRRALSVLTVLPQQMGLTNRPLHLTAPGFGRGCPRAKLYRASRVPQMSGNALGRRMERACKASREHVALSVVRQQVNKGRRVTPTFVTGKKSSGDRPHFLERSYAA
jgi:hypothetical protein